MPVWAGLSVNGLNIHSTVPNSFQAITLDEEKNGYVAREQLLYALKLSAGLLPEVPYKASAPGHVGTWTNQGSRIDYITGKPYLHQQLGVPRAPILAFLSANS